jgi:hypothetical protein
VELRQLATFVAIAEEGSFTRAADRLHVVQSAVSAGTWPTSVTSIAICPTEAWIR